MVKDGGQAWDESGVGVLDGWSLDVERGCVLSCYFSFAYILHSLHV